MKKKRNNKDFTVDLRSSKIFIISLFFLFFGILFAKATLVSTGLTLILSPETPRPGNNFTVEARSYSFDMNHATFTWYRNGKELSAGVGRNRENFIAGSAGSEITIRVTAESEDGNQYLAESKISIADVDLVINPLTYVPVWYAGAPKPTPGSVVEIYALPHFFSSGKRISPASLLYHWSLDSDEIADQSGVGKNVLRIRLPNSRNGVSEVVAEITSMRGDISGKKAIKIQSAAPEVLFYESSSLTGTKSRSLSYLATAAGRALSIVAQPFFFSLENLLNLNVFWSANGKKLSTAGAQDPFVLDLKTPAEGESSAIFSVTLADKKNIFQTAEASLSIIAK